MKNCPNCGAVLNDDVAFCVNCGFAFASQPAPTPMPAPVVDPANHTAEFDPADISENKIFAMLVYLMGIFGVILAVLAAKDSRYVMFHVRQAIKFVIVQSLAGIAAGLLAITFIVPIVAVIFIAVLTVLQIIAFFSVCKGEAKEPAIIKDLAFLK